MIVIPVNEEPEILEALMIVVVKLARVPGYEEPVLIVDPKEMSNGQPPPDLVIDLLRKAAEQVEQFRQYMNNSQQ